MAKYMVAEKVTEITNVARMANFARKKIQSFWVKNAYTHSLKKKKIVFKTQMK